MSLNIDQKVVNDFGKEWSDFDQSFLSSEDLLYWFNQYFAIFPWHKLPENPQGFDLGCGTGRWAQFCAPKVAELHCIDPSAEALKVAQRNLSKFDNCIFHQASIDEITLADNSMDFGYCLGVLHHIPDPEAGIKVCVEKLKQGAPLLLYIYYAFDNRPLWFKVIWQMTEIARKLISLLPYPLKYFCTQVIALLIYFPLARLAKVLAKLGFPVDNFPLSSYRNQDLYIMRNDALDRFGTRLEKRFTQEQIKQMMINAGLEEIKFSPKFPFWCAIGYRARDSIF